MNGGRPIQCTRVRACKWRGFESELKKVFNAKDTKKHGVEFHDKVCPHCGCKTYYFCDGNSN